MNVTLKNGTEEFGPFVAVMMLTLRRLFNENPIAAYEAVCVARDRTHKPWGATGSDLAALNIIDARGADYTMNTSIRNVIISAVEGEGLDMVLGDPIKH